MITSLHLENYKSFKKLNLNLEKGKKPKKIVAIYGENGSGKSNIISAFQNLVLSLNTVNSQEDFAKFQAQLLKRHEKSEDDNFILNVLRSGAPDNIELMGVFKNSYMLDATGPMKIRYDFEIEGNHGYYELIFEKNEDETYLSSEKLHYLIKKSSGDFFEISGDSKGVSEKKWSPSLFKSKEIKQLVDSNASRLWGKHTLLSIFNNVFRQNNREYLKKNISKNFLVALGSLKTIAYRSDESAGINGYSMLLRNMINGKFLKNEKNDKKIEATKNALNKYFVPLYSDINKMYYKFTEDDDGKQKYDLFESKRIGGESVEVPFRLESHGTKRLMDLFPLFLNAVNGETVVIDEIDQGIHDLLIDRIIDNLKDDIEGQLIFTTHDTQVMRQLDASSLYVIQIDSKGKKQVINLTKGAKDNIAAHNNIQKKYLEGYFAGIPYSSDVDFYDIVSDLEVQ